VVLLALTLKHLRTLTGHSWHEIPFTFEHAKAALALLFEWVKPPGRLATPSDLPRALPGQVRRVSVGVPYRATDFGREAAAELISAVEAYSGDYGKRRRKLIESLPAERRKGYLYDMDLYAYLGRELMPLARRSRRHAGRRTRPRAKQAIS
jgi:hypothetical protein